MFNLTGHFRRKNLHQRRINHPLKPGGIATMCDDVTGGEPSIQVATLVQLVFTAFSVIPVYLVLDVIGKNGDDNKRTRTV